MFVSKITQKLQDGLPQNLVEESRSSFFFLTLFVNIFIDFSEIHVWVKMKKYQYI